MSALTEIQNSIWEARTKEKTALAAYAIGLTVLWSEFHRAFYIESHSEAFHDTKWDPYNRDADAVKLACALKFTVEINTAAVIAKWDTDVNGEKPIGVPLCKAVNAQNFIGKDVMKTYRRTVLELAEHLGSLKKQEDSEIALKNSTI